MKHELNKSFVKLNTTLKTTFFPSNFKQLKYL